jgi:hypothetical protein
LGKKVTLPKFGGGEETPLVIIYTPELFRTLELQKGFNLPPGKNSSF